MKGRRQSGHIQSGTRWCPACRDAALAPPRATVTVHRGNPSQGRRLPAIERAQFGHAGQQDDGGNPAHPRYTAQTLDVVLESWFSAEQLFDPVFDPRDLTIQTAQVCLDLAAQASQSNVFETILFSTVQAQQLVTAADQFGQLLLGR